MKENVHRYVCWVLVFFETNNSFECIYLATYKENSKFSANAIMQASLILYNINMYNMMMIIVCCCVVRVFCYVEINF